MTFQLQIFDGREYRTTLEAENRRSLETVFEGMPRVTRRIVLAEKNRPAKPVYRKPSRSSLPVYSVAEKVDAYLSWAKRIGLTSVAVYADGIGQGQRGLRIARERGFKVREVRVADFLGDAPAAEEIGEEAA